VRSAVVTALLVLLTCTPAAAANKLPPATPRGPIDQHHH
jgi:hypothetical protein